MLDALSLVHFDLAYARRFRLPSADEVQQERVAEAAARSLCSAEGILDPKMLQIAPSSLLTSLQCPSSFPRDRPCTGWLQAYRMLELLPTRTSRLAFLQHAQVIVGRNVIALYVGNIRSFSSAGQCPGGRGDRWRLRLGPLRRGVGYCVWLRGGINAHHGILDLAVKFPDHQGLIVQVCGGSGSHEGDEIQQKAAAEEEIEAAAISPGLDLYSTTTRHPVTKRTMPFALPVSGDAILEGSVSKKNRRSLGFYMCIDSIALIPATIGNLGQWHDGQEEVAREDERDDDEDHGDDDDGDMDEDAWPYGRRS